MRNVRPIQILGLEVRNELLKLVRMPAFAIPALCFPWIFYVLFGIILPSGPAGQRMGGGMMATYLLASYGVFGVLGSAMFSLGAGLAIERGQGWTTVRRAMPSAPALHLGARILIAGLWGTVVMLGLCVLGAVFGGVRLPTASWALLLLVVGLCALPFGALGLAIGQLLGPNSAAGVINAIYLPMSFLSGLWIPLQALPKALQSAASVWPSFHALQLALHAVGGRVGQTAMEPVGTAVAALVITTLVAFTAATFLTRRADAKTWG